MVRKITEEAVLCAAEKRGHRNATKGAGFGAAIGGALGSFLGPVGIVVGASMGGLIGNSMGAEADKKERGVIENDPYEEIDYE